MGLGLGLLLGLGIVAGASPAYAYSVRGGKGIEIEGPQDRRGFMFGMGVGGGASIFSNAVLAAPRLHAVIGGGATKNLTLGAELSMLKYLTRRDGLALGADVEVTGFVVKGLFLRGALGVSAVPKVRNSYELTAAAGGRAGLGYEVWMNSRWAFAIGADYDLRVDAQAQPRHAVFVNARFTVY